MTLQKIGLNKAELGALESISKAGDVKFKTDTLQRLGQVIEVQDLFKKDSKEASRVGMSDLLVGSSIFSRVIRLLYFLKKVMSQEFPYMSISRNTEADTAQSLVLLHNTTHLAIGLRIPTSIPTKGSTRLIIKESHQDTFLSLTKRVHRYLVRLNFARKAEGIPVVFTADFDEDIGYVVLHLNVTITTHKEELDRALIYGNVNLTDHSFNVKNYLIHTGIVHNGDQNLSSRYFDPPNPALHLVDIQAEESVFKEMVDTILNEAVVGAEAFLYLDEFYKILKTLTRLVHHEHDQSLLVV